VPSRRYTVRTEDKSTRDKTYTGAELMDAGLVIQLPAKYSSDLIFVEEVGGK
jgi:hypothetical protein